MKLDRKHTAFGRHESFALRYGWLTKGFSALQRKSSIFTDDDATVELGVGKNMVLSIRFWLRACQIIDRTNKPTNVGKMLFEKDGFDPFLEDEATVWLLHWLLVNNVTEATSVYWFFNKFHKPVFTVEELTTSLSDFVRDARFEGKKPSQSTIKNDVSLLTRMYSLSKPSGRTPLEDSLDSPMASLGLLIRATDNKNFLAKTESRASLPPLILGYAILSLMKFRGLQTIPLDDLMYARDDFTAVGAVFRLSENALIKKIEDLVKLSPGVIEIRDTAGIYQLYLLQKTDPEEMLREHYCPNITNNRLGAVA
tara:strand:+ start:156 stop:1085 length:930 start_codon:yes stop_codon:yes gene_type:complete